ncbi:hypothetical protein F5D26_17455 [Burkholderia pseudomallei]|nr:hypothetical protein BURPS668_A0188 [Burkholderia pseudomallei 668]AUG25811.1 hypothetical protein CXQ84_37400 [Burkholderia pseudomallei]KAA8766685.1 hypothetical protein F5D26_17455 [Burkholderia pseudomallei]
MWLEVSKRFSLSLSIQGFDAPEFRKTMARSHGPRKKRRFTKVKRQLRAPMRSRLEGHDISTKQLTR